jgi:lipoate-protein ligase A
MVSVSRYEVTVRGRKIVASAQRRTAGAFLQHGSVLTGSGAERFERYARGRWGSISESITNIAAEIGEEVSREVVAERIMAAFARDFGISWTRRGLSAAELGQITARRREKQDECAAFLEREVAQRC